MTEGIFVELLKMTWYFPFAVTGCSTAERERESELEDTVVTRGMIDSLKAGKNISKR